MGLICLPLSAFSLRVLLTPHFPTHFPLPAPLFPTPPLHPYPTPLVSLPSLPLPPTSLPCALLLTSVLLLKRLDRVDVGSSAPFSHASCLKCCACRKRGRRGAQLHPSDQLPGRGHLWHHGRQHPSAGVDGAVHGCGHAWLRSSRTHQRLPGGHARSTGAQVFGVHMTLLNEELWI